MIIKKIDPTDATKVCKKPMSPREEPILPYKNAETLINFFLGKGEKIIAKHNILHTKNRLSYVRVDLVDKYQKELLEIYPKLTRLITKIVYEYQVGLANGKYSI